MGHLLTTERYLDLDMRAIWLTPQVREFGLRDAIRYGNGVVWMRDGGELTRDWSRFGKFDHGYRGYRLVNAPVRLPIPTRGGRRGISYQVAAVRTADAVTFP